MKGGEKLEAYLNCHQQMLLAKKLGKGRTNYCYVKVD
ncbi:hypothetical protein V6Z12_D01G183100 [Gossypium hirsutum]